MKRLVVDEQMDAPNLPAQVYKAVLDDLARVNRITFASRPTLGFLAGAIGNRDHFRLLDVGFGQGDMLRAIARWAQRRGITAELTGVDLNPNSEIVARAATDPALPIRFRTGDYRAEAGQGYDFVVSSLVAHHMSAGELVAFLRFMEDQAGIGWFVNDLHRHRLAYAGFPLLARLFGWHKIVREDGRASVGRAFKASEWHALLAQAEIPSGVASVDRHFPFRLCVARRR